MNILSQAFLTSLALTLTTATTLQAADNKPKPPIKVDNGKLNFSQIILKVIEIHKNHLIIWKDVKTEQQAQLATKKAQQNIATLKKTIPLLLKVELPNQQQFDQTMLMVEKIIDQHEDKISNLEDQFDEFENDKIADLFSDSQELFDETLEQHDDELQERFSELEENSDVIE